MRVWSNGGLRPELSSGEWLPHRVRGRVRFAISIPQFVEDGPFDTLAFRFSEAQGCSRWLLSVRVEDRRFGVPVRIQYAAAFNRRGVVRCRSVFRMAGAISQRQNPAYSPPSTYHPVPKAKFDLASAIGR